jgi:hypothetical protein
MSEVSESASLNTVLNYALWALAAVALIGLLIAIQVT